MKKHKKQPMNKLHVYTNLFYNLHYRKNKVKHSTVVDLFDLVYILPHDHAHRFLN